MSPYRTSPDPPACPACGAGLRDFSGRLCCDACGGILVDLADLTASINDHLQLERHGMADSMGTNDLRRGVTAFFAGEQPTFEGD